MLVEKQRNIFLIGPMGAGKSTIGRQLALQLGMQFFDSDQEIEKKTGADISWVFDVEGESGFRRREEKLIDELTQKEGIVLATGGGSVKSRVTCNNLVTRGLIVYLETTIDKQLVRTKQRDRRRPLLEMSSKFGSVRKLLEVLSLERNSLYEEISDVRISTDLHSVRFIVNRIIVFYHKNIV